MGRTVLSQLADAGVLERRATLRVSRRFLDHAEATDARLRAQGRWMGPAVSLQAALGTWDDYLHDVRHGALALWEFMAEHHQAGSLQPVFPALEGFAVPAA